MIKSAAEGADMLFSELKCKEVINLRDCRKLGHVVDFEFDECTGCIRRITVPGGSRFRNLLRSDVGCEICYSDIKQIGPDIILVDVHD